MSPEAEVEAAIEQFFHAMDTQDFAVLERLVAHDNSMVHIGTDTGEIWRGWDELRAATVEQFEGLECYDATIKDLQVTLSASGDVAWYSHLLDAHITSESGEYMWTDARFTGVFERRDGRWRMVQTHVSLPESAQS
jgi:ketosteroid isomerase-like protein